MNSVNVKDTTQLDANGLCRHGRRHGRYGCEYHPVHIPLTPEQRTPEAIAAREISWDKSSAADPYTSLIDLKAFATHPDVGVRWSLAGNRVVKGALLTSLLKDSESTVRAEAVANDNATKRQLESMLRDRNDFVRSEARRRLKLEQETSEERESFHVADETMSELLGACESVDDLRNAITVDDRLTIGFWTMPASLEGRETAFVEDRLISGRGKWLTREEGGVAFVAIRQCDLFAITDITPAA